VAIGITRDGRRQVLDFRAVPREGAGNWSDFLESLKGRGIGDPKLFVTDGLQGMPEAIAGSFPNARRQLCLVHAQRNIAQAVRIRDRKEIMDDFKAVYSKGSRAEYGEAFAEFASKWSKPYPKLMLSLVEKQDAMFRFYEFPKPMRRAIYTSNAAESLNSIAKRKTRARIQYNSEDSALIVLAKIYEDYNLAARPARFMLELSEGEKEAMGFER
jgi:transposase-like protein